MDLLGGLGYDFRIRVPDGITCEFIDICNLVVLLSNFVSIEFDLGISLKSD